MGDVGGVVAEDFVKFPRTPHLYWLGEGVPRGDKLLAVEDAEDLLRRPVVVEEKVDGACIGISLDPTGGLRVQSRGTYLLPGSHAQFAPLWSWLAARDEALRAALGMTLVLFGEWCYAQHSVAYDLLPDWFLAFDIYDRGAGLFWSRVRREELAAHTGLATVPLLGTGHFDRTGLEQEMSRSRLGTGPMEGLYLRWEDGPWLVVRAKLVRPGWVPHDEVHWAHQPLVPNRLLADREKRSVRVGRR